MKQSREQFFLHKVAKFLRESGSIVDIGAGSGGFSATLKDKYKLKPTMIEVEPGWSNTGNKLVFIPRLKRFASENNIPLVFYDGSKLPFESSAFDTSLVAFVLHHTDNPEQILREAVRVSRKRIIVYEDIPSNSWQGFWYRIGDSLINFELFGHPHNNKSREEWLKLFDYLGLKVVHEDSWVGRWFGIPFPNTVFVLDK